MNRIVLHVGMTKTATTTIQATFEANPQLLLQSTVMYPRSGRIDELGPCHHALFHPAATCPSAIWSPLPKPTKTLDEMAASVEDERRKASAKTVVLSSERLWNPIAFDRLALMRIRDAFPSREFVILAYLRPVESHAPSEYAQRVVGPQRYSRSFREHLEQSLMRGYYDFKKRLDDYSDVFGRQAVRPIWLPALSRDVLSPFRDVVPELARLTPTTDRNVRNSWIYVKTVCRLNPLHGTSLRRAVVRARRAMVGIDSLAKRSVALENAMNPLDASTRKRLEEKTQRELHSLQKIYGLR